MCKAKGIIETFIENPKAPPKYSLSAKMIAWVWLKSLISLILFPVMTYL